MQDENTCLSDWDAIEKSAADAISESAESFADATVANVRDLIAACRKFYLVPDGVAKGYWSTINLWWEGCAVEVFDDHYEWYRFEQNRGIPI